MKRVITVVGLAVVAMTGAAQAQDFVYGWSVSSSNTDPHINTGAPVSGIFDLYLWLECSTIDGWSAMECNIEVSGPGSPSLIGNPVPLNGCINAGSGALLQLGIGGCPTANFLAASFTLFDGAGTGVDVCLIDSTGPDNWNVTVDCDPVNAAPHLNSVVGYSSTGTPCFSETAPCLVSVEDESWGGIKSLYR